MAIKSMIFLSVLQYWYKVQLRWFILERGGEIYQGRWEENSWYINFTFLGGLFASALASHQ